MMRMTITIAGGGGVGRGGGDGELSPRPCPLLGPSVTWGSDSWDSRRWKYHLIADRICEDNLFLGLVIADAAGATLLALPTWYLLSKALLTKGLLLSGGIAGAGAGARIGANVGANANAGAGAGFGSQYGQRYNGYRN